MRLAWLDDGRHVAQAFHALVRDHELPELLRDEGLKPHKVPQVYVAGSQEPDTVVDVTAYFETKINALCEHKSQIGDRDSLVERLRDRMTDPESLGGSPRLVERFKRIELRR